MFTHLHVHSQYSILDALASVEGLAQAAATDKMTALALTDHGNMFGAVEFYKACQTVGVKPIIGCEVYVAPRSRTDKNRQPGERAAHHLTLLAKNDVGYRNLCKLSSIAYLEGFYYFPRIDKDILAEYSEGLVCLSGCMSSDLSQAILDGSDIEGTVSFYHELFGEDYYLELQRHPMSKEAAKEDGLQRETWLQQKYDDYIGKQQQLNEKLIELSKERKIPLVATNDVHYLSRDDWQAHEILLNVQSGEPTEIWERDPQGNPKFRVPNPKRRTYPSHEVYFKTTDQMKNLFSDIPEAISNTMLVAEKCSVEIDFKTRHYPIYIPPDIEGKKFTKKQQVKSVEEYLWELCRKGIANRYTEEKLEKVKELFPDREPLEVVEERLNYEMGVIVPKGMCDYLLIVWDFIHWAKNQGMPVGPGRGSGAGSIVLYLIGITDIEPLRFSLFFERFINPERISYPDIDVDICMDRRGDVIEYTLNKYGKDNVAQIITFGTMKAKMTIKDVGRVLSIPLSKVNAIAKNVPDDLNITLARALEKDHELLAMYNSDADAKRIIDIGQRLEGSIRNTGIHAAGIIISGDPLTEHIPVCVAKDAEMPVTQFSMKPVEQVGMLKVDFLGLKTLTGIKICVDAIEQRHGVKIDWVNLPLDDKKTFALLNQGATMGVFQLESGGMQELARQLHLDRFEEIIAVCSLYRPGPMDMIPSFINRKHGKEAIESDHPWMKEILDETYGIMVYQEQVMQIAQKLANYSLGEGDVLRRAMGKKDMKVMAKERKKFQKGAMENGIDADIATRIFDKMEKFAEYGFNKSHAAAYGYVSYVTAYLKANYPSDWMAALMTCVRDDISKVSKFIREAKSMGLAMLPPDVNEAGETFVATDEGLRFAMSGIKGVGSGVVEAIVKEREKRGPFKGLYEFIKRIDTSKVGKKAIESLIGAGSFDFTSWSRDALRQDLDAMFSTAIKEKKEEAIGVMSLFDQLDEEEGRFEREPEVVKSSSKLDLLFKEKELLGFFLTGHPLATYGEVLKRLSCVPFEQLQQLEEGAVIRAAFVVETVGTRFSAKSQKKFAILTISDGMESYELPIWPEMYEQKNFLLLENQLLYAVLQIDRRDGDLRLQCRWLDNLIQANEQMIAECDAAYEKAKNQRRFQRKAMQKAAPKVEEKPKEVHFVLNADNCRLSHVLEMRNLFDKHSGPSPYQIHFEADGYRFATLHGGNRGINPSAALDKEIKKLPYLTRS